ncbi:CotH kinase family protein [Fibrobacter sp.]|uniref:CotH kinase family protein n=1 Tax=Fibrobacter sp. TaxID=35828 RepID=UPI0038670D5D
MRVLDGKTNSVADSAKGTLYDIGIKVRGQSSALFPKPGYGVEVRDEKGEGLDVSLFGLPPADDWVFHGPYVDKSMMRNALAHWLFRQAGHYSPRTKHFDLYINGVYRGVYVLIEKIKRGKYRVNVSKLKETDIAGDSLTGGYIWAFDKTGTNTGGAGSGPIEKEGFNTSDGLNVILHYPKKENIQKQQEDYLKKYLNDLEGLFKNGKNGQGYENYVDMTSALDYVLHEEVTNNADSYWCSFFLHKPKDKTDKNGVKTEGKVTLGPAWDFNLAMSNGSQPENGGGNNGGGMWGGGFGGGGNGFGSSGTSGWQIENSQKSGNGGMWGMGSSLKAPNWLLGMWKDSHYQSELKKRWAELRSGVWHTKTLDLYLDSMKTYLKNAADRNFKRWPNLGKSSGQNDADPQPMKYCNSSSGGGFGMPMGGYNATTWDGEFEHLRKKMKERMQWMDEQLGFKEPSTPITMAPVDPSIHDPDWQNDGKDKGDSIPMNIRYNDLSRLSPTNFFVVIGNYLEIHTDMGGKFALVDLNGAVLYKTQIKAGTTNIEIPTRARDKHWIATLNGKMLSK